MKSQKTNAFQLAVAGAVLVLVLVCATFAWFAVGDHAFVNKILASISSPEIPAQINSIEYSPTGGADATDWSSYNGEKLTIEPGKVLHFRVSFTAAQTDNVEMNLINIDGSYRQPETTTEGETTTSPSGEGETQSTQPATTLPATDTAAKLAAMLEYRVHPDAQSAFTKLSLESDNRTANILEPAQVESKYLSGVQYVYYYDIKMSDEASNEYMNSEISFDIILGFSNSVESADQNA